MIELRCDTELHAKLDGDRGVEQFKCKGCSRREGRPVFHYYPILDIIERYKRGEVSGVVRPDAPHFVHWRVTTEAA